MLDFIRINHRKKTIEVIDIKTTGAYKESLFKNKMIDYRYHRQGAFYLLAMQYYISIIREELKDYKIVSFQLFVIPKNGNKPYIVNLKEDLLGLGLDGGTFQNCYIPGINQLIQRYKTLIDNDYPF